MKLPDVPSDLIWRAADGELAAMENLLKTIEPGIFNLAMRMLGDREDARDASQEILLKVVTHLGSFRHEAAFTTWVYQVARNHLLTAATRSRESPEVSFEGLQDKLAQGLAYGGSMPGLSGDGALTPEDKAAARQTALGCTQGMLMALDRDHRLAYLLDVVLGLPSEQAASIVGVTAVAFRKRVSRARERLHGFMGNTCGLVSDRAACRCERQLPAIKARQAMDPQTGSGLGAEPEELAKVHFDRMLLLSDAAAVFRAHPNYRAPAALTGAIRNLLVRHGYMAEPSSKPSQ